MAHPRAATALLAILVTGSLAATSTPATAAPAPVPAGVTAAAQVPDRSKAYSAARAKRVVERRVIGRSVQGRPITAIRKGNPDAAHTVLILGQMHGDEPAGPRTVRAIVARQLVDSDTDLWLIPSMNPDGAALGTRKNARGVDLNRNWPTSGFRDASSRPSSLDYRGPAPGSEVETQVMMRFLRLVQPELIASVHQPLRAIGRNGKTPAFIQRLSRQLGLPARELSVGTGTGRISPTLTGWYNDGFRGGAVTVEYVARPSTFYVTRKAAGGLLRATLAAW